MELKARLAEVLQLTEAEEQEFISTLSAEEMAASGSGERWSARDLISHIAEWNQRIALRLAAAAHDEAPATYDDLESENAIIFERNRDLAWADVLGKLERAHHDLAANLQALPEDALAGGANRFTWHNGQPLWVGVVMNGYWHPTLHLGHFNAQRGRSVVMNEQVERSAAQLRQLDPAPAWQGKMVYDLACYYALTNQLPVAIDRLREALRLNPGLAAWSRRDTDLKSLWAESAYLALVAPDGGNA